MGEKLKYGTIAEIARKLGISRPAVCKKLYKTKDPQVLELAAQMEADYRNKQKKALEKFHKATSIEIM